MKLTLKSILLAATVVCVAPFSQAQITIHDFSQFQSPGLTYFVGDWALTEPTGDENPIATFSQGAGFYTFSGGTNADTSGAFAFLASNPGDLTGNSLLQVSARLLAQNAAPTFTVSLFSGAESAFAVFSTSDFVTASGFLTVSSLLTATGGFDPTLVDSFSISGGVLNGNALLNLAVDHLAVAAPGAFTAVPEPSTYAASSALLLLALVVGQRFRRR